MTAWTHRVLLALAALILLSVVAGCGGTTTYTAAQPINDQLFVPNYVADLDGKLYHWPHLPMRACFHLPDNWAEIYGENQDLHIRAADQWNQPGLHAMISAVPVGAGADVPVYFVSQRELGGNILGRTEFVYDTAGFMHSATIKVALYDSRGRLIPADDVEALIAHELGHALGIAGHSLSDEDLMYEMHVLGSPRTTTIRDLNTAMTAYPGYFGRSVPMEPLTRGPVEIITGVIE